MYDSQSIVQFDYTLDHIKPGIYTDPGGPGGPVSEQAGWARALQARPLEQPKLAVFEQVGTVGA